MREIVLYRTAGSLQSERYWTTKDMWGDFSDVQTFWDGGMTVQDVQKIVKLCNSYYVQFLHYEDALVQVVLNS